MHLTSFEICNYKGLTEVRGEIKHRISVVVGPNAVGKSSLLDAIRLAKGVLAPRFPQDTEFLLTDLGLYSPNTRTIDLAPCRGRMDGPINVRYTFAIDDAEVAHVEKHADQLTLMLLRAAAGIPASASEMDITQFLSTPDGQASLEKAEAARQEMLDKVRSDGAVSLHLIAGESGNSLRGGSGSRSELMRAA